MVPAEAAAVATEVVAALARRRQTVACAESLTGGLVCAALTTVPGASAVVAGGVVAYTVDTKRRVLGVPAELLDEHGTVAAETAAAMASAARRLLRSDWAVATTGVAGPDPSEGKPVGTVHVAVVGSGAREDPGGSRALNLNGSREDIRAASVVQVLDLLLEALTGD
jgi:nicotinamide-nucleotide amidase